MNYLYKRGTKELWEVSGRKEEGWGCQRHGLGAKHQSLPLPPLEHISHNTLSILTNTLSFTPGTDLPNNKATLPSSPLFLHSAIHSFSSFNHTQ